MRPNVSNSDLLPLVRKLNSAMDRLGLCTRYEIEMGNKTLGRNWILVENRPGREPIRQHMGSSSRSADWFMEGMLRALQTVALDRDLALDRDYASRPQPPQVSFDPDARAVRRGAEEESFPFHAKLPQPHEVRHLSAREAADLAASMNPRLP